MADNLDEETMETSQIDTDDESGNTADRDETESGLDCSEDDSSGTSDEDESVIGSTDEEDDSGDTFEEDDGDNSAVSSGNYNSVEQPQRKRLKLDRLSTLPDAILLHILSILPVDAVVRLGILSSKYRDVWKYLNSLNLFNEADSKDPVGFVNFVHETLLGYKSEKLENFCLTFDYEDRFASSVNRWLEFAVRKNVRQLKLNFMVDDTRDAVEWEYYKLPEFLYDNETLTKIETSLCNYAPKRKNNWRSLKKLCICYTTFGDGLLQEILSGCPVLENFELSNWSGPVKLDIKSVSLKTLALIQHHPLNSNSDPIEISAPHLQWLRVSGYLDGNYIKLLNLKSLLEADITFRLVAFCACGTRRVEMNREMVSKILQNICHVKRLSVGFWCIQTLSTFKVRSLPSALSVCKHLKLECRLLESEIPGLSLLLDNSPLVETLVLDLSSGSSQYLLNPSFVNYSGFDGGYTASLKKLLGHLLPRLKVLKVVGFSPVHVEVERIVSALQIFLSGGEVLERIVIKSTARQGNKSYISCLPGKSLRLAQKLLSLPRASPHAIIEFV